MKLKPSLVCVLVAAAIMLSGCGGGNTPAASQPGNSTITEGVMTTSVDNGSKPTGGVKTSFPVDSPIIYCSFKISGVAKEDMIKATWIYVGGALPDKANTQINETYDIVQAPEASYYLAFYLDKPVGGWYKGDYKVVLSVNNKEKLSVPFKME
jgi:hypothetical protein